MAQTYRNLKKKPSRQLNALQIAGKDLLEYNPPEVEAEMLRLLTENNDLPSPKFGTSDLKSEQEKMFSAVSFEFKDQSMKKETEEDDEDEE